MEAREIAEGIPISLYEERGLPDERPFRRVPDFGSELRVERIAEGDHSRDVRIGRGARADPGSPRLPCDEEGNGPEFASQECHGAPEVAFLSRQVLRRSPALARVSEGDLR